MNPNRPVETALIAAFRALPIRKGTGKGIPYEVVIPGIARQLTLLRKDSPTAVRKRTIQERLVRAQRAVANAVDALDDLPQSVLDKLNYKPVHKFEHGAFREIEHGAFREVMTRLRILKAVLKDVKPTKNLAGAKEHVHAKQIAAEVAEQFYRLTGEPPTRSKKRNRFGHLLAEVFEALGIDAKRLDTCARQAVEAWEKLPKR